MHFLIIFWTTRQFGFRPAILVCWRDWHETLEQGGSSVGVFFDLSKAAGPFTGPVVITARVGVCMWLAAGMDRGLPHQPLPESGPYDLIAAQTDVHAGRKSKAEAKHQEDEGYVDIKEEGPTTSFLVC